jgi:hypothetical protein
MIFMAVKPPAGPKPPPVATPRETLSFLKKCKIPVPKGGDPLQIFDSTVLTVIQENPDFVTLLPEESQQDLKYIQEHKKVPRRFLQELLKSERSTILGPMILTRLKIADKRNSIVAPPGKTDLDGMIDSLRQQMERLQELKKEEDRGASVLRQVLQAFYQVGLISQEDVNRDIHFLRGLLRKWIIDDILQSSDFPPAIEEMIRRSIVEGKVSRKMKDLLEKAQEVIPAFFEGSAREHIQAAVKEIVKEGKVSSKVSFHLAGGSKILRFFPPDVQEELKKFLAEGQASEGMLAELQEKAEEIYKLRSGDHVWTRDLITKFGEVLERVGRPVVAETDPKSGEKIYRKGHLNYFYKGYNYIDKRIEALPPEDLKDDPNLIYRYLWVQDLDGTAFNTAVWGPGWGFRYILAFVNYALLNLIRLPTRSELVTMFRAGMIDYFLGITYRLQELKESLPEEKRQSFDAAMTIDHRSFESRVAVLCYRSLAVRAIFMGWEYANEEYTRKVEEEARLSNLERWKKIPEEWETMVAPIIARDLLDKKTFLISANTVDAVEKVALELERAFTPDAEAAWNKAKIAVLKQATHFSRFGGQVLDKRRAWADVLGKEPLALAYDAGGLLDDKGAKYIGRLAPEERKGGWVTGPDGQEQQHVLFGRRDLKVYLEDLHKREHLSDHLLQVAEKLSDLPPSTIELAVTPTSYPRDYDASRDVFEFKRFDVRHPIVQVFGHGWRFMRRLMSTLIWRKHKSREEMDKADRGRIAQWSAGEMAVSQVPELPHSLGEPDPLLAIDVGVSTLIGYAADRWIGRGAGTRLINQFASSFLSWFGRNLASNLLSGRPTALLENLSASLMFAGAHLVFETAVTQIQGRAVWKKVGGILQKISDLDAKVQALERDLKIPQSSEGGDNRALKVLEEYKKKRAELYRSVQKTMAHQKGYYLASRNLVTLAFSWLSR